MAEILAATKCGNCGATTRVVDTDNAGTFCSDCLFSLINRGVLVVYWDGDQSSTCVNCGEPASWCEDCSSGECRNCGDNDLRFCSADCAVSYEGLPDEIYSTCINCSDDDAYYCSPQCAYNDCGETVCTTCNEQVGETMCEDCREDRNGDRSEQVIPNGVKFLTLKMPHAAEPMQGVDDTTVNMDGITFEFDIN